MLRLKYQYKAQEGHGEFFTFQAVRPCSPGPLLRDARAKIASNLGSIFGYAALNLAPLGPWIRLGWPSSTGTGECIDLASQYALETVVAFQHGHSDLSLARASKIGSTALRSLQSSIELCQQDEDKQALILAVMLHFAAENFAGIATWRYIPHLQGICFLLKAYFEDQPEDRVVQEAVSLICDHEITAALHFGQPSQLEAFSNPQYSLDEPPPIDVATLIVNDLLIRIPRTICALRACLQDQDDIQKMSEACTLAKALYHSANASWVQKTVTATSRPSSPLHNKSTSPSGITLTFDSIPALTLSTRYTLSRLMTCGLLQKLTTHPLSRFFFPGTFAPEVEAAELSAATFIAECLDFALRPNPAQVLVAVTMIMPLEACVGTWSRLQRRERAAGRLDSLEFKHAVEMQDWCIEHLQRLCSRWRAGPIPRRNMEQLYDVLVGGPLVPSTYEFQENGVALSGRRDVES
ncbi:hypothetical protein M409DRAFT_17931 [Zasmidium cellare ATCC 36951]|uniref:Transcription factor domain-containing protein n=1 Tax=Zasmidium cellare ATCC 36951 TaxID=1080233 RepID=A0A6A6CX26_ZASCE|nr:uncharacterized protein M409DRAFT_17931 [Zasmidium cellare ATCC 36951]KAF2171694.1 hypothetical protein M409DRAFT_17931 [Zasmidium cellare ATCC 36951]